MSRPKAVPSFEELVSRDSLVAGLLTRTTVIFALLSAACIILYWLSLPTLVSLAALSLFLTLNVSHFLGKRMRSFVLAEVTSVKELTLGVSMRTPLAAGGRIRLRLYSVTARQGDVEVSFLDSRPRKVGEKVLLLLNRRRRVIAVGRRESMERIEFLEKLR